MKLVEAKPDDFQIGRRVWLSGGLLKGYSGIVRGRAEINPQLWDVWWDGDEPVNNLAWFHSLEVDPDDYIDLSSPAQSSGVDEDHCECRAPWWAFWNPHSRFGWMFFALIGACVPGVLESISMWVRSI